MTPSNVLISQAVHPLVQISGLIRAQDLDDLDGMIARSEEKGDHEMANFLRERRAQAQSEVFDRVGEFLGQAKQDGVPLTPLSRPVIVRLASQEKVTPEELSEDLKLQVVEFVGGDGKTREEIGDVIHRDGQSLASLLKNMVADGRIEKRGGLYRLPTTQEKELVPAS